MGAFLGASNFFDRPLIDIAINLGYSDANICVLQGDIHKLRSEQPQTYNNLMSCRHHADGRSAIEYGQDLVASWIVEDTFLAALNQEDLTARLDGADQYREILANVSTSTSSDFEVSFDGKTRKLELMNDYTGFWARNHVIHLRDNKFLQMKREHSLFLAVSMITREFMIFDFARDVQYRYIPYHRPYGGKPAYAISVPPNIFKAATSANIIAAVKELID